MNLYPFQTEAVDFHLAHHYSLNCSEMGLGKTAMALETAAQVEGYALVFGPAFLEDTWQIEAKKIGVPIEYVSYSRVHKVEAETLEAFDFWIADECHYLKSPTARRTHAFYALLKECRPEYFIGLTGTPIKNRVPDLWTLLGFCSLNPKDTSGAKLEGELTKYRAFSRHFCVSEIVKMRGCKFEKFRSLKEDKVPELKALLKDKMIRFKVEDVLKDLPIMTRKEVFIPVSIPKQIDLMESFEAYMHGKKTDITAKAKSALLKAKHTAEYCQELIDGGSGPLLVFTDHILAAESLAERLDADCITGEILASVRADTVREFQTGKVPVLVATIGSLSVGVTLTAARHVVFNDLSWVPSDNLQAEKRIHRIGQKGACFSHYIDSTATDRFIRKTLFEKMEAIEKVI